jgi:hypothetical protein
MTAKTQLPPHPTQAQPPDEKFWVKYSRHHELPISGMASLAWHTLVIGLVIIVAWVIAASARDEMPLEVVSLLGEAGSGGTGGIGTTPNIGNGSPQVEAVEASQLPPDAERPTDPLHDIPGLKITPKDLFKDVDVDKDAERDLMKFTEHGTKALKQLAEMDKKVREKLLSGIGNGTPGANGGSGGGTGGGTGNEPGAGTRSARAKRTLRWTLRFNTESGGDYLSQVSRLGAILAFKSPDGELKCVKDLSRRPVKLETEDLPKLNRIFWIDDRPDSVEQLARAMGLDFVPDRIYALFPHEFEKELLDKELAFRNKKEEEIIETRFLVVMRPGGHAVYVTDQRHF